MPVASTEQDFHATDGSSETLILRSGTDVVQISITPGLEAMCLTVDVVFELINHELLITDYAFDKITD